MMKTRKMMLLVCVLLANLVMVPSAKAQFSLGLKVAGNATNYIKISELNGGVDAGVFLRMGNAFYLQPELCYSFRSTELEDDAIAQLQDDIRLQQHFIDLSVLLGYNFINKDNIKFHLIAGPRFGVRVGSNINDIQFLKDEGGKFQWGGRFGLGFDFWRFTLDACYDISANKFHEISGNPEFWKQNMIVISLGFKLIK